MNHKRINIGNYVYVDDILKVCKDNNWSENEAWIEVESYNMESSYGGVYIETEVFLVGPKKE